MTRWRSVLALVALILGIWLIYYPGFRGGFIFDDIANLVNDDNWRLTEWTLQQVSRAVSYGISSPSGRPLALLSFAVNHYWFGTDPYWLKAGNVLLHCINTALVWLLTRSIIGLAFPQRESSHLALIAAATWALHPMHVSTVLYIVQRMEVGAATGTLLSLYAYINARTADEGCIKTWLWLIIAALALTFGVLFKETAILSFGFAFLIEVFFLHFKKPSGGTSVRWIAFYTVGATIASAIIWFWLWPSPEDYAIRNFNTFERILTQGPVLVMYIGQALFPFPDSFKFYYDDFPVSTSLVDPIHTLLSWTVLLSLVTVSWAARIKNTLASFGIAWFFVAHSLTSSFIPLELAFEHRNYLAILGLILAVVSLLCGVYDRLTAGVRRVVLASTLLTFAGLTHSQTLTWGEPTTLALALERRASTSQRASYAFGSQLLAAANNDPSSPLWPMARNQWVHANRLSGDSILPLAGILLMDARAGEPINPEMWRELRTKASRPALTANHVNALRTLVDCRVDHRCIFDDRELVQTLTQLLQQHPQNLMLHMLYSNFAWNVLGDRALAISMQRAAATLAPNDPGQRLTLAAYLLASGESELRSEAIELIEEMELADRDGRLSEPLNNLRNMLSNADDANHLHERSAPLLIQ